MKKSLTAIVLSLGLVFSPLKSQSRIPILFEHPRDGKFKWVKEQVDFTTLEHYVVGTAGQYTTQRVLVSYGVNEKDAAEYSFYIWLGLGTLKEVEDGFREGYSWYDWGANITGQVTAYYLNKKINHLINKKKKTN